MTRRSGLVIKIALASSVATARSFGTGSSESSGRRGLSAAARGWQRTPQPSAIASGMPGLQWHCQWPGLPVPGPEGPGPARERPSRWQRPSGVTYKLWSGAGKATSTQAETRTCTS